MVKSSCSAAGHYLRITDHLHFLMARILVIRGGAIGDFILTLPAIRLLREAFPAAHLELLGHKHIVALAERRFYAHATRSIESGPLAGFFSRNAELDPELVEYFASFQQIVSYLLDPIGFLKIICGGRARKTSFRPGPGSTTDEHVARQLARPMQSLALSLEQPAPTLFLTAEDRALAARFFGGRERLWIALHPGSSDAIKNWPLTRWRELGDWLLTLDTGTGLLLVGGEADHAQMAQLEQAWAPAASALLVARDLPLPLLAAVIERCRLFLGHDTGISHLAAAIDVPCVLLFGPTDPAVWAPANANVSVVRAPGDDLAAIDFEAVQRTVICSLAGER
jgi:heptosyltransferase-3